MHKYMHHGTVHFIFQEELQVKKIQISNLPPIAPKDQISFLKFLSHPWPQK